MGLSKDESKGRRITTSLNTTPWRTIFRYANGKYRCTPIQAWTQNDLAAYIAKNGIPLLSAYNDGLKARTTARITRNQAEMNGMKDLKNRDITAYNIIVERFPELSAK
jgi:3'-phosphoadenosine 5'-phosphosulfate sulfotransferase (PAPS reductase)/FAD synthetase